MGYKINPNISKDDLLWEIRNTYIPSVKTNGRVEREFVIWLKKGAAYYIGSRGFSPFKNYQNSFVKGTYLQNNQDNHWEAHGRYLQREGAQIEGKVGLGFDKDREDVNLAELLEQWQREGDPHVFKLIISPEQAEKMDLKRHVRLLMQQIQIDYGAGIEWAAIDHYNTDNVHVHVVMRGKDMDGVTVRINRNYFKCGFRQRSKEIATRQIGPRGKRDILKRREMAIQKNYITELDRDIVRMKDGNNIITFKNKLPKSSFETAKRLHIIGRLQYLQQLGFVEQTGIITWKVGDDMMKGLRAFQIAGDVIKRKANHISAVSEKGLPVKRTFLKEGEHLTGRIIGFGLHDENYDKRYFLVEGIDGKVHYLHPTKKIIKARSDWTLRNNDVVHLIVKRFYDKGKKITYLEFNNWGSLRKIKGTKEITEADKYFIRYFIRTNKNPGISADYRAFRKQFFNVMNERYARLRTIGYIDKNLNIKRRKIKRD